VTSMYHPVANRVISGPTLLAALLLASLLWLWTASQAQPVAAQLSETANAEPGVTAVNPEMLFGTFFGGNSNECQFDRCTVAVGPDGAIYVAGTTTSADFPRLNSYGECQNSRDNVFVLKIAANGGSLIYSSCVGPGAARGIAVDNQGHAYVTGNTASSVFPTTANAVQPTRGGGLDAFVVKLSTNGSGLLYGTYLGGARNDDGWDIAVDNAGSIYVTGGARSADFPTANAFQPQKGDTSSIDRDAFVTKINASGAFVYSTYLGGEESDIGYALALDNAGHVYVGGVTYSNDFPKRNPIQTCRDGNATSFCWDGFVTKFAPDGRSLVYSTHVSSGLTTTDSVRAIAVDAQSNAYVTGTSYLRAVLKINAAGSAFAYYTAIDGLDIGQRLAVNELGQVWLAGNFRAGAVRDARVAALNSRGHVVVNHRFGGSDEDQGTGIALANANTVYVVGHTRSPDFPTLNPLQAGLRGPSDLFITQLRLQIMEQRSVFLPLVIR
jgi:hypothetical protein